MKEVRDHPDFVKILKEVYHIDVVFHASGDQKPYGYTLIDNEHKIAFKGSEVLPLKELLGDSVVPAPVERPQNNDHEENLAPVHIQSIWIADDVDDQQIHGMRRRRQRKARTNTR